MPELVVTKFQAHPKNVLLKMTLHCIIIDVWGNINFICSLPM